MDDKELMERLDLRIAQTNERLEELKIARLALEGLMILESPSPAPPSTPTSPSDGNPVAVDDQAVSGRDSMEAEFLQFLTIDYKPIREIRAHLGCSSSYPHALIHKHRRKIKKRKLGRYTEYKLC